jgi:hypothetical protein
MSPSCNFIRFTIGNGESFAGVRIQQISFEQRMTFVIEVVEVINTLGARKLREELLE